MRLIFRQRRRVGNSDYISIFNKKATHEVTHEAGFFGNYPGITYRYLVEHHAVFSEQADGPATDMEALAVNGDKHH
jgi:hypothetical protein